MPLVIDKPHDNYLTLMGPEAGKKQRRNWLKMKKIPVLARVTFTNAEAKSTHTKKTR